MFVKNGLIQIFCWKNTMLLSNYCILTLGKKRCKKNLFIWNLSFNGKFKAIYTTKLEFCTLYDVNEKETKCNNVFKNNELYLF